MLLICNAIKVMLFISDAQYYVPLKVCITAESIHLFKITRGLNQKHVHFRPNILSDILKLEFK